MVKYLRHIILVTSLFLSLAFALPAKSEPDKVEIDNYARANGFPRSDYPYYEPVNSCGGEGATSAVPDKYEISTNVPAPTLRNPFRTRRLVVFRADFNDACNNHDRCYMTTGAPRENCDARFLTDLLAACDSGAIEQQFIDLISGATATCTSLGGTYAGTVAAAGEFFYPNAQSQARRYRSLVNNFIASSLPNCGNNIEIRPTNQNLTFSRGTSWETCNGYLFVFQDDGNLVLYNRERHPLWASNTRSSNPPNLLAIQTDGNMVLYRNGNPVWAVNPGIRSGAFLAIQTDGNVVLYDNSGAYWSTNTRGR